MTDLSQPRAAPVNRMKDAPEPMVRGFAMRMYSLMQRAMMSSRLGVTFGGKRDMYEAFGWPRSISEQEIWDMYRRGGIA
ncbi:hypothetical protein VJJ74_07720, partial [Parvimonas micra]|uniref:hypothetical protein n=3 Tax=Parvimonas TaxID=543311 RepID=UPI002B49EA5E